MHRIEIRSKVVKIVRDKLAIESDQEIKDNDDIIETLGGDSLDTVEFILILEDEFGIKIDEGEETDKCTTINKVVDLVGRKLAKSGR